MKINMPWWQQRTDREQILIKLLTCIGSLLIIYNFLYLPLANALDSQYIQLKSQYQLLQNISQSSQLINRYQQQKITVPKALTKSLLVTAEKNLSAANLSSYLTRIKQTKSKLVSLSFNQIPFDKFITWIKQLTHQYPISISQLNCQRTKNTGIINVKLTIQLYA